jgi:hypothetical protein
MDTTKKNIFIPKLYQTVGFLAFFYAGLTSIQAIYDVFFYVDGTWLHGFIANGSAVVSGIFWITILYVFKLFLNNILHYTKSSLLLNAYMIFIALSIFSLAKVLIQSIELYQSLDGSDAFNAMTGFATTSISGALLLLASNFAIILICILLGNRLRTIRIIEPKLFMLLGYTFIIYGVTSLLVTIGTLETDSLQFGLKTVLATLIGLILTKIYATDRYILQNILDPKSVVSLNNLAFSEQTELPYNPVSTTREKINTEPKNPIATKSKENTTNQEQIPFIDLNDFENSQLVLPYYENLAHEERSRLEFVVSKKYHQNLTEEQKKNLVIQYILEHKLYDHQRFLPK